LSATSVTLILAAASVGALHTAAPDHWMPFGALARVRGWNLSRTARTAIICGFGHVTVTAILGIAALFLGITIIESLGSRLADQAIYLLMAFGAVYMVWGLWGHKHHQPRAFTEGSLFLLFCSDPCVALIPMIMASATEGWGTVVLVIVAYERASITTMVLFVSLAFAGANAVRGQWIEHYGHAAAGALILSTAAIVALLGI
jgi:hypothetical protein